MAQDQPRMPWCRGLILRGELAGQYEIDSCSPAEGLQPDMPRLTQELCLDQLAPITIFVGANNSGKSRLLRGLFGDHQLIDWFKVEPPPERNERIVVARLFRNVASSLERGDVDGGSSFGLRQQNSRLEKLVDDGDGWLYRPALERLSEWASPYESLANFDAEHRIGGRDISSPKEQAINDYLELTDKRCLRKKYSICLGQSRCYIPMLRGMRPLPPASSPREQKEDSRDVYELRTFQDYFSQSGWPADDAGAEPRKPGAGFEKRPRIFTGLGIYADMQRRLLSPSQAERDSIRTYEQFLSEQFFSGLPVTLTPALHQLDAAGKRTSKGNDVVYLRIGDSDDRPIYDLGDGMQSLIICTYPIITEVSEGGLFFLEEPDLCMHPSLQRIFLNVLRDYHGKKGHQFFLTTHSNHLLDLLEDNRKVSIFSFSRVETAEPTPLDAASSPGNGSGTGKVRFRIRPSSQRDRAILQELGVRPSATYLANATIWVEGTSDCSYLRAYMNAFTAYLELRGDKTFKYVASQLKRYKEDRHFAFVEYNGSNLVHFCFNEAEGDSGSFASPSSLNAPNLCAQALVIADGDIAGKAKRVEVFSEQLNDRFVVLPVKEIENLIPEEALRSQIEADRNRKLSRETCNWPKTCDMLTYMYYSARNVAICNLKRHGLGYRLEQRKFSGYQERSGTLKSTDKKRWACRESGIPGWISKMTAAYASGQADDGGQGSPRIPPYLNQDLIWLCLVIFCHVARLNHDYQVERDLNEFKTWIASGYAFNLNHFSGPASQRSIQHGASAAPPAAEPAHLLSANWPIPNPSEVDSRLCLLSQFLANR